jgi:hypothetical protein
MASDVTVVVGEEPHGPIAWPAILAGAVTALAMAFTLGGLAAGFSLKLGALWPGAGAPAAGFNPMLGVALLAVQAIAFALGGYVAGRLRTRWQHVHGHEVFFRDTAHGLLVWASATVAGLALSAVLPATPADAAMAVSPDAAAQAALFVNFGLLLGAFVAAVAAAIGGYRRDDMHALHRGAPRRA